MRCQLIGPSDLLPIGGPDIERSGKDSHQGSSPGERFRLKGNIIDYIGAPADQAVLQRGN